MPLIAALCAGFAVLFLLWPFCRLKTIHPAVLRARRLQSLAWGRHRKWAEMIGPYIGLAEADRLCQHAGRPWGLTGVTLIQYQFLFALLCTVGFGAAGSWVAFLGGGLAWFMPRLLLSSQAQQRRAKIALELPAFLDLWGLLVASGEAVESALVEISRRHPDWQTSAEVRRVLERVSASGLFGESLVEEAKVTGSPELVAVAEQVSHLVDGGGVPSRELSRIAHQMREQRVTELVQSAGAMAVIGIFPKLGAVFLSLTPVITTIALTVIKHIG